MQQFNYIVFRRPLPGLVTFVKEMWVLSNEIQLNSNLNEHDENHKLRTFYFETLLLPQFPFGMIDYNAIASILNHDGGRVEDGRDINHGDRGAELYRKEVPRHFPWLDHNSNAYAIAKHNQSYGDNGKKPILENMYVPKNIEGKIFALVGDADRGDLPRCDFFDKVDLGYINTEFAKQFFNTKMHRDLYNNGINKLKISLKELLR